MQQKEFFLGKENNWICEVIQQNNAHTRLTQIKGYMYLHYSQGRMKPWQYKLRNER